MLKQAKMPENGMSWNVYYRKACVEVIALTPYFANSSFQLCYFCKVANYVTVHWWAMNDPHLCHGNVGEVNLTVEHLEDVNPWPAVWCDLLMVKRR